MKEVTVDGGVGDAPTTIQNKDNIPVENEELAANATKYAKEHKVSYLDALTALTTK